MIESFFWDSTFKFSLYTFNLVIDSSIVMESTIWLCLFSFIATTNSSTKLIKINPDAKNIENSESENITSERRAMFGRILAVSQSFGFVKYVSLSWRKIKKVSKHKTIEKRYRGLKWSKDRIVAFAMMRSLNILKGYWQLDNNASKTIKVYNTIPRR